ncbi:MAG: lytic murein transglycosylase B [Gammaproteobacteria bacterium]|nr:lytic murein transglycosylase B [Gammaproteobacteria bacterium]
MYKSFLTLCSSILFASLITSQPAQATYGSFEDESMINAFINEMVQQHQFDSKELKKVFQQTQRRQSILDAIARPAESKPWSEYRPIFLTRDRLQGGLKFWKQNADILSKAHDVYGVPEEIIVAIIGVETRYGRHAGRYPVMDALATLAFAYPPRSKFFRKELQEYLIMTREEGLDPLQQKGSYAGAMGMPQFIASSFRRYAIDFSGDGQRDLWSNKADVIGSVANYFKQHRWNKGEPIAHRVRVHGVKYKKLLPKKRTLKPQYTQKELLDNGVILPQGIPAGLKGNLIELQGKNGPEYWVTWHNFYVISRYNHSALYSMAVFQLSQRLRSGK